MRYRSILKQVAWLCLFFPGIKGTTAYGQWTSPVGTFYGLWNGVHPMEVIIQNDNTGEVRYSDTGERIHLQAVPPAGELTFKEVLTNGTLAGTWRFSVMQDQKAMWSNYNQTSGAYCVLSDSPQKTPDLQIRLLEFRTGDGDWFVFLSPSPPDKWVGIAWTTTSDSPFQVKGKERNKTLLLDLYHGEKPDSYQLQFATSRTFPRFGWWQGRAPQPEKVRFRHRKSHKTKIHRHASFYGETLILEPELTWPSWRSFANRWIKPQIDRRDLELRELTTASLEKQPWQRNAVRLYSWVAWSFLRSDLLSGTLHIANSWEEVSSIPFLISARHHQPLSIEEIWHPWPVPRTVQAMLKDSSLRNTRVELLELRPDGLYIYSDHLIHIPTTLLRGTLPRESPLYPYFGK